MPIEFVWWISKAEGDKNDRFHFNVGEQRLEEGKVLLVRLMIDKLVHKSEAAARGFR